MTRQLSMFAGLVNRARSLADICAGRHGNQPTSVEANPESWTKEVWRIRILELVTAAGAYGITLDEVAHRLKVEPNRISGRFTELHVDGAIVRAGDWIEGQWKPLRRLTRLRRWADVWIRKGE